MALFASLSERLNHIFSKLTKRGKLTELEIRTAMTASAEFKKTYRKNLEIL